MNVQRRRPNFDKATEILAEVMWDAWNELPEQKTGLPTDSDWQTRYEDFVKEWTKSIMDRIKWVFDLYE
jgi:hypothetical protein